jgi:phytoene dehydrogenase-like protein
VTYDAIVVGAGPNGLVGANLLADRGWSVLVLEAQPEPGGAVRSGEVTVPGFCHDLYSAFYPLGAVSPALAALDLESHGLRWRRAPTPLAHVFDDGRAAVIDAEPAVTAASVDEFARGDGEAWLALVDEWRSLERPLVDALLTPFPPIAAVAKTLVRLRRPRRVLEIVRRALLPVRRFAAEHFEGEGATMLLAGYTLHTDLGPDSALGGLFAWLLAMLAQSVGFPVPEGGSGQLTNVLVRRLEARGGQVVTNARVVRVLIRDGRAHGVEIDGGEIHHCSRALLADVLAPTLYRDLVGADHLSRACLADLDRFDLDHGTVKVDWALRGPVPWIDQRAAQAGTVHLGGGMEHLTMFSAELSSGQLPTTPFVLFGQMSTADPTRSPAGTETAWAYTHVPNTARPGAAPWTDETTRKVVDAIEDAVERRAPGFRDLVLGRHVMSPLDLERTDANLRGGAINGGTAQLHQQLVFRPTLGRAGPQTPIERLYLASSSAHPGGAVHGACGANAARAALRHDRTTRLLSTIRGRPPHT